MHVCIFCVYVKLTKFMNVCVCVNIKPSLYYLFQARKFKANGDLEKAKRFADYSLGFIIPGLVFIILTVILVGLSLLGGLALIMWILIGLIC